MPQAGYAQLSHYQKLYMKEMLEKGFNKITIAEKLHVSKGTIYNELKRGTVNGVYFVSRKFLDTYWEKTYTNTNS